jgi:GTP-binding protein HflX
LTTLPATTGTAFVLHPVLPAHGRTGEIPMRGGEARLEEAVGLAAAIGLSAAFTRLAVLKSPKPGTLFGKGVIDEVKLRCEQDKPDVVIVDGDLSPVQQRNLEKAWNAKVIDRTGLILEIFGERARTAEGQLQVELAALQYQRSRLVRSWTHLERQRGGFGFVGGPGERQLELDRRLIERRIDKIKEELEDVRRTRGLARRARERVPYPVVALVGYTNAGKSTLFNRIAGADVFAADLLFATLDPTMRALPLRSGRKAIFSDTVGFISDLPTDLVAAFRATLEEVQHAELILHVRDAAHPDSAAQAEDVRKVMEGLGIDIAHDPRLVEVLNKSDLLPEETKSHFAGRQDVFLVSALTGEGMAGLLEAVDARLVAHRRRYAGVLAPNAGGALSWLYERGEVLERRDEEDGIHILLALDPVDQARFSAKFGLELAEAEA